MRTHQINITYAPKDPYILRTPYNHGNEILLLLETNNTDNNTPGFEFNILLFTLITAFILTNKYKKRKK